MARELGNARFGGEPRHRAVERLCIFSGFGKEVEGDRIAVVVRVTNQLVFVVALPLGKAQIEQRLADREAAAVWLACEDCFVRQQRLSARDALERLHALGDPKARYRHSGCGCWCSHGSSD